MVARPIIGLEEFVRVRTYNFNSPQIGDSAGDPNPFSCLGFHDFMRTFLVSCFPFGSVSFLLFTGLSLKFIVVDLVPVSNFLFYFSLLSSDSVFNRLIVTSTSLWRLFSVRQSRRCL